MVSKKKFDKILRKKGVVLHCREVWWERLSNYRTESGNAVNVDEKSLKVTIDIVIKNGCKVPCGL